METKRNWDYAVKGGAVIRSGDLSVAYRLESEGGAFKKLSQLQKVVARRGKKLRIIPWLLVPRWAETTDHEPKPPIPNTGLTWWQ